MFRVSQSLKALARVFWTDTNVYKRNPAEKAAAEAAVKAHYDKQKLEEREVAQAAIRGPFHRDPGDSEDHVTVDYQKSDGTHVTTHHVTK